ncbi:MAG: YkvA family protein [Candidatus Binatia bacterium]
MRTSSLLTLFRFAPQRLLQVIGHLPNFLKLFWRLLKDRRVPLGPKLLLIAVLAYVFMPIDLLPDFLVGLGQIDDLVLIFLGLQGFVRLCPRDVVREHVHAIAAGRST